MSDEPRVIEPDENLFAVFSVPQADEADLKSRLAMVIRALLDRQQLTQAGAAERMGLTQPDVSSIMNGRLRGFSVERLLESIVALGEDVTILVGGSQPRRPGAAHAGKVRVMHMPKARRSPTRNIPHRSRPRPQIDGGPPTS